jgi:PAS domain S-box-containing protein
METTTNRAPVDFRRLFAALPGSFLILLPDPPAFTIVEVSDAFLKDTHTDRETLIGRPLFEAFPDNPADPTADGVANLRASLEHVLRHRASHRMEVQKYDVRRPASQGGGFEARYWSPLDTPILDSNGDVELIVHCVEDVTDSVLADEKSRAERDEARQQQAQSEEHADSLQRANARLQSAIDERSRAEADRRALEQALRESEARYRSIVETALEGIWVVDTEWRTTFVNQRMAEMLGHDPADMQGRQMTDFMCDGEQQSFAERREERLRGLGGRFDCRLTRKDGSELWVTASAAALPSEHRDFTGAVVMMSDITERKRLESVQARMAAIVAGSEDAIVSKDLNGIVTSWNAAAERMYGWKAEDIIGRSKGLVIPPDLPEELPTILRRISAGERIEHYETRRIRKDGTLFDAAISVSPVRDTTGTIIGAATIVRDITERKRTERELRRKQEEVEALNKRLQLSVRETHHRVKNNLQIISAMVDMHNMDTGPDATVPLKELKRIASYIRTLAIVHDLLTQSVRENEEEQRVSSSVVIGQLIRLLEDTAGVGRIRTKVDEVELLSKQAVTLSLIINELVSNAVKHAAGSVDVDFEVRGTNGELRVCDDGKGFPKQFDPYVHANTGLELVMGTVGTDLNGDAFFENRLQGGACVRVTFPLPQLAAAESGS